jgi:hypothetical protein
MSPESEFSDLLDRAERMWSATLLLLITFSLLLVSTVTLLFTVFVTFFSYLRNGANVLTEKVTAEKGATFREPIKAS